jgi:glycosyltransferase involved in cell wall biosynthesis
MNILLVGNYPACKDGPFTGPMRVVYYLAESLSKLDDTSVTVMTPHRMRKFFARSRVLNREDPFVVRKAYAQFLRHGVKNSNFDIVNIHGVSLFNRLALRRSIFGNRCCYVYTAHGLINLEKDLGYSYSRLACHLEEDLICDSDFITTVSEDTKRFLYESYPVSENKIMVIGNGVDTESFYPGSSEKREDQIHILFVGDMLPVKGLEFLFKALQKIQEMPWKMVLAGKSSSYFQQLQKKYKTLFDSDKVIYMGLLGQSDLLKEYIKADFCVLPSAYDQFPQVVLEAMAMGKPVIVSDRVGNRHLIRKGKNGFIVPFGKHDILAERIKSLAESRDLLRRMKYEARDSAEQNRWIKIAMKYREFFLNILEKEDIAKNKVIMK